ncbi:MAG: VUT family protein [Clostridia bacterium]
MSPILFFSIFTILCFLIVGVAIRFFPKDATFTIAIGAVIGANIYTSLAYPISIGGITFGIDSIVYTLFLFCLLLMHESFGKKNMRVVLYTALFSIFFTAFLFFMGNLSQGGYSNALMMNFLSYLFSIIATFCAAWVMIWLYDKFKLAGLNIYLNFLIVILLASLVNTMIYFGLSFLLTSLVVENFLLVLVGSYIGKFVASMCCLGVFALHRHWCKSKEDV